MASLSSWLALAFAGLVRAAGGPIPRWAELGLAVVAAPVAVVATIQAVGKFWRGPTIVEFGREDALPCSATEATFVRERAQLRGLMGGAGFLYPRRLVFPGLAWLTAAIVGLAPLHDPLCDRLGPWPVLITLAAGFAAFMMPARPYFYRDTAGGGAIVSPPSAAYRLRRRAELAAAVARGEPVGATTPAPTPAPPSRVGERGPAA